MSVLSLERWWCLFLSRSSLCVFFWTRSKIETDDNDGSLCSLVALLCSLFFDPLFLPVRLRLANFCPTWRPVFFCLSYWAVTLLFDSACLLCLFVYFCLPVSFCLRILFCLFQFFSFSFSFTTFVTYDLWQVLLYCWNEWNVTCCLGYCEIFSLGITPSLVVLVPPKMWTLRYLTVVWVYCCHRWFTVCTFECC